MKFHLFRRPYNVGMAWKHWKTVEATNSFAALKTTEFKDEVMWIDRWDTRRGILGGASEFVALTDEEVNGWTVYSELPERK